MGYFLEVGARHYLRATFELGNQRFALDDRASPGKVSGRASADPRSIREEGLSQLTMRILRRFPLGPLGLLHCLLLSLRGLTQRLLLFPGCNLGQARIFCDTDPLRCGRR
jgi:hypothetical protein